MKIEATIITATIGLMLLSSCGSKSNKRAIDASELDAAMKEDAANAPAAPARNILSADELLQLSKYNDGMDVQLYMKDRSADFFYGKKGEFSSLNRGAVADSTGAALIMPFSTLYFSTDPGAEWRLAHTVHKKELSDQLLNEFIGKGFSIKDSFYYHATKSKCYRYSSEQFPGEILYYSATYTPWHFKGLYKLPTWLNYIFEIHPKK